MAESHGTGNRTAGQNGIAVVEFWKAFLAMCVVVATGFGATVLTMSKEVAVIQTEIANLKAVNRQQGAENHTQNQQINDVERRLGVVEFRVFKHGGMGFTPPPREQ